MCEADGGKRVGQRIVETEKWGIMGGYPVGYGKATVTFAELKRRYSGNMEPEYARRLFAWIESKDGAVGIGGASRPNPSNTSAASKLGRSFHQIQTFADGSRFFCAVDLVHTNSSGGAHRAIQWSEVPEQGSAEAREWGLHCNVQQPQEPWHIQPIEFDGFGTWEKAGRPRPQAGYQLPGNPGKVRQPKPVGGDLGEFSPEFSQYGLYPAKTDKGEVDTESRSRPDDLVRYLQGVLTNQCHLAGIDIDGYYGDDTEGGVRSVQKWNGLEEHGRCDAATWVCIDSYATR